MRVETFSRSPKGLAEVGETLYGPRWQSALARDLGVSIRTVQFWAAGERRIPDAQWAAMVDLLDARADQCQAIARAVLLSTPR